MRHRTSTAISMAAGISQSPIPTQSPISDNETIKESTSLPGVFFSGNSGLPSTEQDVPTPTRLSMFTLTALLGCIYGFAFLLAIVWIVWLWLRRKPTSSSYKRSHIDNTRDACSINSMS